MQNVGHGLPSFFQSSYVGKVSPENDLVAKLEIEINTLEGSTILKEDPSSHKEKGSRSVQTKGPAGKTI